MSASTSTPTADADRPSTWQQGAIATVTIESLTDGGDGLGHYLNRPVFVPQTVPGDEVDVRLIRVKPSHGFGLVRQLVKASTERDRPNCIVADKCGGCQWQHVKSDYQLAAKTQILRDALTRIGGFADLEMLPPALAAPSPWRYRNKVSYPIATKADGSFRMGYYTKSSHRLINLNQCPVQDERFDPLLRDLKVDFQAAGWTAYNETKHDGDLRHLSLRVGRRTGQLLLTLIANCDVLPGCETWAQRWLKRYPNLRGVCVNVNQRRTNAIFGPRTYSIAGSKTIEERLAGVTFQIDSTSFFQVYTEQAERFFEWIVDQLCLTGSETVVDAYCGIGTLSLPLARRVRSVTGIESHPAAVDCARANAQRNDIANATFLAGKVEFVLPELETPDIVFLDPPRRGCDRQALATLIGQHPERIVYVSCHPATLARDVKILTAAGHYRLVLARAADFFPQTAHVEAVVFLERI
ncbi:MAG: 23S rRNA (uracil(1939)-C(5))-methyltransferase RlmD [Cyanobacteria bacterium P01_F01_bin.33]